MTTTTTPGAPAAQGLRRAAAVLLLAVGLVVASAVPSWASFTARTAAPDMSVATTTVAPPGNLTASATCKGNNITVTLKWTASSTSRVSGYRVRLYLDEAWQDQATLGATATSWQGTADTYYATNYVMTFTVWTLTEYGWSAESARTPRIVC